MVINWTRPAIRDIKDFKEYSLTNTSDYILELTKNVNLLIEQPKFGKIFIPIIILLGNSFINSIEYFIILIMIQSISSLYYTINKMLPKKLIISNNT